MFTIDKRYADKICEFYALGSNNILLGSKCDNECKFCSSNQLPPHIKLAFLPQRSLEEVKKCVSLVDRESKVVIITEPHRILQGDPLNYPQILDVIKYIRKRCPKAAILVPNTLGVAIDRTMISVFSKVKKISFNISLVSTQKYNQDWMLNDAVRLRGVIDQISKVPAITYGFTIIAMAQFLPWKDIEETIFYLDRYKPRLITVYTYTYTDYSRYKPAKKDNGLTKEFSHFIKGLKPKLKSKVIFYPITENQPPLVFGLFDEYLKKVSEIQRIYQNKKILALVSEAVFRVAQKRLKDFCNIKVKVVKNLSLGGNIVAGGLLSTSDYINAAEKEDCDLIIIPDKPFTKNGLDLFGRHFNCISKALHKPVMIIKAEEKWHRRLRDYEICHD
jgi:wyosine [tRNA(Phe)-imidazoG37] synthetase (radical SAM superfamily)